MRPITLLIASLAALTSACTTLGGASGQGPSLSAERGQRLAQRACAGCHNIGAAGESPNASAPAFGTLRLRYTAPQLERRLAAISGGGHYEMPPIYILKDEAKDLAEYVESLGR